MSDIEDAVAETVEKEAGQTSFGGAIAALVAVAATVLAVGNIKDGNIVQAMAQAQAKSVSKWSQYQSKSTKQNLAESAAELLDAQLLSTPASVRPEIEKRIAFQKSEAKRYEKEKGEISDEAKGLEAEYDRLNIHDDQFDMAEACLSVAIALSGIAALTHRRWLFYVAIGLSAVGVLLVVSGFAGWGFHPNWLARWLG